MAPAGPDRSKLSKGALKSLQDAEALFVSKLSEASDDPSTPTIEDLLKPELRADYVKNLEMDSFGNVGGFSLYVKAPGERFEVKHYQRQGKQLDEPVVKHYADESFKPLIDFHLPETAGKVLAAEISKWPGCYAKRVFLSDEEKLKHGFKCKAPVAFTHVAISKEGGKAFKSGEVMEPTKAQLACKRFYDERCAAGTPGFRIAFRIPDGIVHKPFNIEERGVGATRTTSRTSPTWRTRTPLLPATSPRTRTRRPSRARNRSSRRQRGHGMKAGWTRNEEEAAARGGRHDERTNEQYVRAHEE